MVHFLGAEAIVVEVLWRRHDISVGGTVIKGFWVQIEKVKVNYMGNAKDGHSEFRI